MDRRCLRKMFSAETQGQGGQQMITHRAGRLPVAVVISRCRHIAQVCIDPQYDAVIAGVQDLDGFPVGIPTAIGAHQHGALVRVLMYRGGDPSGLSKTDIGPGPKVIITPGVEGTKDILVVSTTARLFSTFKFVQFNVEQPCRARWSTSVKPVEGFFFAVC